MPKGRRLSKEPWDSACRDMAKSPCRASHGTCTGLSWSLDILGKIDTNEAKTAPPGTTPPGPPFSEGTSHTHRSCKEGRWENIRSLISENVPFTRLLRVKEQQNKPGFLLEMLGRVGYRPDPLPVLQTTPLGNEA